jgi:hypothetical protein
MVSIVAFPGGGRASILVVGKTTNGGGHWLILAQVRVPTRRLWRRRARSSKSKKQGTSGAATSRSQRCPAFSLATVVGFGSSGEMNRFRGSVEGPRGCAGHRRTFCKWHRRWQLRGDGVGTWDVLVWQVSEGQSRQFTWVQCVKGQIIEVSSKVGQKIYYKVIEGKS